MRMGGLYAGQGVGDASGPGDGGEVVIKWLGAGVGTVGVRDALPLGDGIDIAGDARAVEDGDCNVDAPRLLTITAAVGSEDRKGDVIDPNGWELEGYRRNPVFLWAHDRSIPPIGQSRRIWVEAGALHAVIEFAATDFAREVAELYLRGFMRGVSVGFLPLDVETREASNGRRGYLYRRQELLEISAVPVPMHSDALASRSLDMGLDANAIGDEVRELWSAALWMVAGV